jgi:hypothetical protein
MSAAVEATAKRSATVESAAKGTPAKRSRRRTHWCAAVPAAISSEQAAAGHCVVGRRINWSAMTRCGPTAARQGYDAIAAERADTRRNGTRGRVAGGIVILPRPSAGPSRGSPISARTYGPGAHSGDCRGSVPRSDARANRGRGREVQVAASRGQTGNTRGGAAVTGQTPSIFKHAGSRRPGTRATFGGRAVLAHTIPPGPACAGRGGG